MPTGISGLYKNTRGARIARGEKIQQTNFEHIKAMSFEEMVHCNDICPLELGISHKYCSNAKCVECRTEYLKREVKENDR